MSLRLVLQGLAAVGLLILLPALSRAGPSACEPARIALDQPELPAAWRAALEAVVEATAREGQPWSCAGGELSLSLDDASPPSAILRLRDTQGRTAERRVAAAKDLLPIAEALLAAPLPAPAAPERAKGTPSPEPRPVGRVVPAPPPRLAEPRAREPRILLDGLLGARYGGPLRSLWGAAAVRVTVPLEDWSLGVWARLGLPYTFDPVPADFSMSEVSVGISAGRRLLKAPFELTATFDPSIAVVSMEGGEDPEHHEGARGDLRLGWGLRAALHWTDTWRGMIAIDGELSPAGLLKPRQIDPMLPAIPAYGLGASLGVEAVIR